MFQNIQAQASDASQLIPQHNYKLDVHALNTRHPGEVFYIISISISISISIYIYSTRSSTL